MHPLMELPRTVKHRVSVCLPITNLMLKAQRIVVHDHQRLLDIGQDAARHQFAIKTHLAHRQVVEAVDDKGIETVIELAFQVISGHHRINATRMEHAAIDFPIELETFGFAMENGIFRRFITARLVVAMVDLQSTLQLLKRSIDGNNLTVTSGIETQRVHLGHLDGEIVVRKLAILGEKLEHARQNATGELEITVFQKHETSVIRHDDHAFAVTQRNGRAFHVLNLAGDAENQQVVGGQIEAHVWLTICREGM